MPNWCMNRLSVSGRRAEVQKFNDWLDGLKEDDGLFNAVLPMRAEVRGVASPARIVSPAEREAWLKQDNPHGFGAPITQAMHDDYMRRFGADNWYDWAVRHWDTKWDCRMRDVHNRRTYKNGCGMSMVFDTAWAPPSKVAAALSDKFPALKFSLAFDEPGMCLKGVDIYGPHD